MDIPFFKFDCSSREIDLVTEVLRGGWLTTAGKVSEFEGKFRNICATQHALAVNSCTAGLHLALEALGIGPGDQVVVPSLTFTASAEVIRYLGADPIFVDVDFHTGLMNAEHLDSARSRFPDIKACIVVHFGGQSAQLDGVDGLWTYCQKHDIKLLQDAAHAFPASDRYGPVGTIGDATCFSFYANKTITTGEGGMIVTNNDELAGRIRQMRLHGINRDVWDRFTNSQASWEYDVVAPGYKYNMPDINAAVGLAQLERAEIFRQERQRCALQYLKAFADMDGVGTLKSRVQDKQHAWHLMPILIDPTIPVTRDSFIIELNQRGVSTSVHYKPLHKMSYYRDKYQLKSDDFPQTEKFSRCCISLPIYPGLKEEQINHVVGAVEDVIRNAS